MTPERVAAASAAWVWVPDEARTVEDDELLLVRYPDWFLTPLVLARFTPRRPLGEAFAAALTAARTLDWPELLCWVRLDAPPGWEDLLRSRGATPVETLDVLALDLRPGTPDLGVPPDSEVRPVDGPDLLRDFDAVNVEVFGGELPPEEHVEAESVRAAADLAAGRAARMVAYVDGEPVGSGGLTVADGVARLWGGAVLEASRGRGVYRALLAARLEYAAAHGASVALVKGRVETSGPILRRAGFAPYGQERSYRLSL
ncbi:GNAT family N-acetyltransferase [Nocardioides dongkuii]|uniref:GNAT family N-acetyltransferase n=1 Tax=Nocardioides dongkuii TaxID=2760089 RepID=UPI0015F7E5E2|nr:GNAT family N-acetyltransferase [Nocardioides dongkuii]